MGTQIPLIDIRNVRHQLLCLQKPHVCSACICSCECVEVFSQDLEKHVRTEVKKMCDTAFFFYGRRLVYDVHDVNG